MGLLCISDVVSGIYRGFMVEDVKYSILIPVYNVEKYVAECIDSALNQTYSDYEIVIIIDGSTDNSATICEQYAEKNNKIKVYYQKNMGLMMARKAGIEHAIGEYLIFVDSDDTIEPNLLERIDYHISKDNLDMIVYNYRIWMKDKYIQRHYDKERYNFIEKTELINRFLVTGKYNNIFLKAVRKSSIDNRLDDIYIPVSYSEDALQTIHFLDEMERCAILDECLYNYRQRKSSLIGKAVKPSTILETVDVHYRVLEHAEKICTLSDEVKQSHLEVVMDIVINQLCLMAYSTDSYKKYQQMILDLYENKKIIDLFSHNIALRKKYKQKMQNLIQKRSFIRAWLYGKRIVFMQRVNNRLKREKAFE